MDQNMKKMLVLIGILAAILVVCIVVVGMVDGFWPWQNQTDAPTNDAGTTLDESQTTQDTLETTQNTTAETTVETTEETSGNSGGNPGGNAGGNAGGNSGGDLGDIEIPIETTQPGPEIGVEEGEDPTGSSQGGNNQGGTNVDIDFDDLLGK